MKKPRGEAILKNLPDALQEELWQTARRTTLAKALAWLQATHGVEVSEATLSVFFSWYPRSLTLRLAASTSSQLEATLRNLPALKVTAEQARSVAQVNFEIQAAQDRDPVLFAALRKGELEAQRLQLEREKHEWAKKTDIEKGLDALFAEIKGQAEALKHFEAMKAALAKAKE
jgi:septal ring factor EnvC (AmiA/AmiB activator)